MAPSIYDNIKPALIVKLKLFDDELRKRGISAAPCNGFRSLAEQRRLYAKGRTTPGPKVTNAKPGSSPHNFGYAMDYIPVMYGKRTYNVKALWWLKFGLAAKAAGLRWGGTFKRLLDRPHVELPGWDKKK
jgi:peptidoglycan L-alanyl-D-glutamate endopeptidase CwlK